MKNNIQLYINNQLVDTFNNDLGIRINNVLNDPTKLIPSLGEYSFTFKLPVTKTNAHIFNNFFNIINKSIIWICFKA